MIKCFSKRAVYFKRLGKERRLYTSSSSLTVLQQRPFQCYDVSLFFFELCQVFVITQPSHHVLEKTRPITESKSEYMHTKWCQEITEDVKKVLQTRGRVCLKLFSANTTKINGWTLKHHPHYSAHLSIFSQLCVVYLCNQSPPLFCSNPPNHLSGFSGCWFNYRWTTASYFSILSRWNRNWSPYSFMYCKDRSCKKQGSADWILTPILFIIYFTNYQVF